MSVLCPKCSRYVADGKFCPFCGGPLNASTEKSGLTLKSGTVVGDRYVIGEVLGRGEFGVTYSGFDNRSNSRVTIIEYLPEGSAKRDVGGSKLLPLSAEKTAAYESGKAEFMEDAKGLTELGEGNVRAKILNRFEQNGTAYCVSESLGAVDPGKYVPNAFFQAGARDVSPQTQPIPPVVEYGNRQPEQSANQQNYTPQQGGGFNIPERKVGKKKSPILWIGISAAALIIILVIALLAGGGKKDKKDKGTTSDPVQTAAVDGKESPAPAEEEPAEEPEPAVEDDASLVSIAGFYKATRWMIGTLDYTDQLATFDLLNMRPTLEIGENNTGTLTMFDDEQELKFDLGEMTITAVNDGTTIPFTLNDGVISFNLNANDMDFTPADRVESDSGSGGSSSSAGSTAEDEDRAADAVSLSFGDFRYNAGWWNTPALEPETPIENCTGFTLCFRYDMVDTTTLGQHRVYVCINKHNKAWLESNRMDIPEEGVVYRTDIRLDKARNVEGIALLPVKASENSFRVTAWIENIQYAK